MQTISRKFLIKTLPDLSNLQRTQYSRFYLFISKGIFIRVQHGGGRYELKRKIDETELMRNEQKIEITQEEFKSLSELTTKNIRGDSYQICAKPQITLRVYHGKYEGLNRAEVKFESMEKANKYKPLHWFGEEITNSPLAKDGKLLGLSEEEFRRLLK